MLLEVSLEEGELLKGRAQLQVSAHSVYFHYIQIHMFTLLDSLGEHFLKFWTLLLEFGWIEMAL
jgi:hypothetical protein